MPPVGVPAPPWMWAKARSKLAELIRLCGDGVVSNEVRMESFVYIGKRTPSAHEMIVLTHHHTVDAPRWRSRPALDVGEGQKQTSCIENVLLLLLLLLLLFITLLLRDSRQVQV